MFNFFSQDPFRENEKIRALFNNIHKQIEKDLAELNANYKKLRDENEDYLDNPNFKEEEKITIFKVKETFIEHEENFCKDVRYFCVRVVEDLSWAEMRYEHAKKLMEKTAELIAVMKNPADFEALEIKLKEFASLTRNSRLSPEAYKVMQSAKQFAKSYAAFLLVASVATLTTLFFATGGFPLIVPVIIAVALTAFVAACIKESSTKPTDKTMHCAVQVEKEAKLLIEEAEKISMHPAFSR